MHGNMNVKKSVVNEKPNKWRPSERRSYTGRNSCFWQDLRVFPQSSPRKLWDRNQDVQVDCIRLSKGR